jgi:hypothetical protein
MQITRTFWRKKWQILLKRGNKKYTSTSRVSSRAAFPQIYDSFPNNYHEHFFKNFRQRERCKCDSCGTVGCVKNTTFSQIKVPCLSCFNHIFKQVDRGVFKNNIFGSFQSVGKGRKRHLLIWFSLAMLLLLVKYFIMFKMFFVVMFSFSFLEFPK